MKKIADVTELATVSNSTVEALSTPCERALAVFEAAFRLDRVEWEANGATVALVWCGAVDYCVTVDGTPIAKGTLWATLEAVKRLVSGLEVRRLKPTPTARPYEQYAFWADVQDGYFMCYAMHSDGGWDEDPAAVEFACQHMLDRVNADFGTEFTMDEFQEGDDCTCAG